MGTMIRLFRIVAACVLPGAIAACATTAGPQSSVAPVTIGIAALNDFHGALEPPKQSVVFPDGKGDYYNVPAGGAAWLASTLDAVRAKYPNHITVSAGDMIGSTPITSALFLDEPTVEVMNRIGMDFNAVGNHELDLGIDELRRKQVGGCAQFTARKPCQIEKFRGAQFGYLAANTLTQDGKTLFPGTALRSFGKGRRKVTVGLIGMTLKGTDLLIPPEVQKLVRFSDEADTANALVDKLKAQGADAIVLIIHQGGRTSEPGPDSCQGLSGDVRPILDRLDTRIDVIVSGHTHWDYVCEYGTYNPAKPFLMTSAGLWGKLVTDITLEIDPVAHKVLARRAKNVVVQSPAYRASTARIENTSLHPQYPPRADIAAYVARYGAAAADYSKRPAGRIAATVDKLEGPLSNTGGPLGGLIADSQLAATAGAGAQVAFMNPFGIRRSLNAASDGSVSFGDLYAVQPFNNELVTISLTGAEIKAVLEQGLDTDGPQQLLSPSAGFHYVYDRSRPVGERIAAITLNGTGIDPVKNYRVTVSLFLANGGDTYTALLAGRDRVMGMLDVAALEAWLQAIPPRAAPAEARILDLHPELNPNKLRSPPGQKYR